MAIDRNGNLLAVGDSVILRGTVVKVLDDSPGDVVIKVNSEEFPVGSQQFNSSDYDDAEDNTKPILTCNGRILSRD